MNIPNHLKSTVELIKKTFPDGIDQRFYFPLLNLLAQEMSDRNLAECISISEAYSVEQVINDIYKSHTIVSAASDIETLVSMLNKNGYQYWLQED